MVDERERRRFNLVDLDPPMEFNGTVTDGEIKPYVLSTIALRDEIC